MSLGALPGEGMRQASLQGKQQFAQDLENQAQSHTINSGPGSIKTLHSAASNGTLVN